MMIKVLPIALLLFFLKTNIAFSNEIENTAAPLQNTATDDNSKNNSDKNSDIKDLTKDADFINTIDSSMLLEIFKAEELIYDGKYDKAYPVLLILAEDSENPEIAYRLFELAQEMKDREKMHEAFLLLDEKQINKTEVFLYLIENSIIDKNFDHATSLLENYNSILEEGISGLDIYNLSNFCIKNSTKEFCLRFINHIDNNFSKELKGLTYVDTLLYYKEIKLAIIELEALVKKYPKNKLVYSNLVDAYYTNPVKNKDKIHQTLLKAFDALNDEKMMLRLTSFYYATGDSKNYEKYLKIIIKRKPKSADALNELSYFYAVENKNLKHSLSLANKALEIKPNSSYILDTKGWALYRLGEFKEAKTYLEKSFAIEPTVEVLEHIVINNLKLNAKNKVREEFFVMVKKLSKKDYKNPILKKIISILE